MNFYQQYLNEPIFTGQLIVMAINVLLHFLFAGAVAKDAGQLNKRGPGTCLVSGLTWAFATLVGGVIIASIYWVLHHSTLTRRD